MTPTNDTPAPREPTDAEWWTRALACPLKCAVVGYCAKATCAAPRVVGGEPSLEGTFACPICGVKTPHHHGPANPMKATCPKCDAPPGESCRFLTGWPASESYPHGARYEAARALNAAVPASPEGRDTGGGITRYTTGEFGLVEDEHGPWVLYASHLTFMAGVIASLPAGGAEPDDTVRLNWLEKNRADVFTVCADEWDQNKAPDLMRYAVQVENWKLTGAADFTGPIGEGKTLREAIDAAMKSETQG